MIVGQRVVFGNGVQPIIEGQIARYRDRDLVFEELALPPGITQEDELATALVVPGFAQGAFTVDLCAHSGGRPRIVAQGAENDDPARITPGEPGRILKLHDGIVGRRVESKMQDEIELRRRRILGSGRRPALRGRVVPHGGKAVRNGADWNLDSGKSLEDLGHGATDSRLAPEVAVPRQEGVRAFRAPRSGW